MASTSQNLRLAALAAFYGVRNADARALEQYAGVRRNAVDALAAAGATIDGLYAEGFADWDNPPPDFNQGFSRLQDVRNRLDTNIDRFDDTLRKAAKAAVDAGALDWYDVERAGLGVNLGVIGPALVISAGIAVGIAVGLAILAYQAPAADVVSAMAGDLANLRASTVAMEEWRRRARATPPGEPLPPTPQLPNAPAGNGISFPWGAVLPVVGIWLLMGYVAAAGKKRN